MTVPVLLRRAAELDVVEIEDWYEGQRQGRGHEFREMVDAVIARIADNPLAYPERRRGARRAVLWRFPCVLRYRSFENFVVIMACVHGKRHPRAIRARLRGGG